MTKRIECGKCNSLIPRERDSGRCDQCGAPYQACPSCGRIGWGDHCVDCGVSLTDGGRGRTGDGDADGKKQSAFPDRELRPPKYNPPRHPNPDEGPARDEPTEPPRTDGGTWSWLGWLAAAAVTVAGIGWYVTQPLPQEADSGPTSPVEEVVPSEADRRGGGASEPLSAETAPTGGSPSTQDVSGTEDTDVPAHLDSETGEEDGVPRAGPGEGGGFSASTLASLARFDPADFVGTWTGQLPRADGRAVEVYLQLSRRPDGRLRGLLSVLGSDCSGRLEQREPQARSVVLGQAIMCPNDCRNTGPLRIGKIRGSAALVVRTEPADGPVPESAELGPAESSLPPLPPGMGDCGDP